MLDAFLDQQLAAIRDADRYRLRRVVEGGHGVELVVDGRRCVNFCSNDYLGLAGEVLRRQREREQAARATTQEQGNPMETPA